MPADTFSLSVFTYDFTVGPLAYCVVGETSATRLRAKSVGLARMTYNLGTLPSPLYGRYQAGYALCVSTYK